MSYPALVTGEVSHGLKQQWPRSSYPTHQHEHRGQKIQACGWAHKRGGKDWHAIW